LLALILGDPATEHSLAELAERTEAERNFHEAMLGIYRRKGRSRLQRHPLGHGRTGGLETARYLLHAPAVSEGYAALWSGND
jgi:hypothetical protein